MPAGAATSGFSASTIRGINAIVTSGMGSSQTPGVIVGIWEPGRTFTRAYGIADPSTDAPLSTADAWRIASITKTFTATVVLKLVEQGRLRLDDTVSTFVPDIPDGSSITVAELLQMRAGVYDYTADPAFIQSYFANPDMPFSAADALAIIRAHQPDFAPGTKTEYSDSDYLLLQLIAQAVTGKPLSSLVRQDVLAPLHLTHTTYPTTSAMTSPFSHGFLSQPTGPPRDVTVSNPAVAGGAGAMISDLQDLHIWAQALASGALLDRSIQRQRLRTTLLSANGKITIRYGMGIFSLNGFLGHDGAILGYSTAMFTLPTAHATIVVGANNDNLSGVVALTIFVSLAYSLYPAQFPHGV